MGNGEWGIGKGKREKDSQKTNSAAPLFTFAFQLVFLATIHAETRPAAVNLILFLPVSVFAIMEAP